MNAFPPARSLWRTAWKPMGLALMLSLLFHLLGGLLFRAAAVTQKRDASALPLVTFLSPTAHTPSLDDFRNRMELADPSVSSLPNREGFSRTTIDRAPQLPSLIETRHDAPQLLPRQPFDATNLTIVSEPPLEVLLDSHANKQPAMPEEELEGPFPIVYPGSAFTFRGPIQDRKLLSLASIPTVRSPAPPQPSVVRISVSPIGEVKFAIIEKSCGADDKDARAIDIVRRWRFQAVSDEGGDQWGTVSIYWAAEPGPPPNADTNRPSAGTSAP